MLLCADRWHHNNSPEFDGIHQRRVPFCAAGFRALCAGADSQRRRRDLPVDAQITAQAKAHDIPEQQVIEEIMLRPMP